MMHDKRIIIPGKTGVVTPQNTDHNVNDYMMEAAMRQPTFAAFMCQEKWPGESEEKQKDRMAWIQSNFSVVCPHCWKVSTPITYTRMKPRLGMAVCRNDECGQAFSIFDTKVTDRNGNVVTENYNWPTSF